MQKKIINGYLFLFSILLISFNGWTQGIEIHGSVLDGQTLEALPGVHIFTDLRNGTVSDIDGNFDLSVEIGDTLRFSMIGYDSLALLMTDTANYQSLIISLKEIALELNEVQIFDFYQSNTILKLPPRETYQVPGINYPEEPEGKNYRLGVAGAIFHPMTAIYRMTNREYKQHKRLYLEFGDKEAYKENYAKAKEVFYEALEVLGENFDEYYMIDFFNYTGLTVKGVASRSAYDLVKILPQALERYYAYIEQKTPSEESNGASNK